MILEDGIMKWASCGVNYFIVVECRTCKCSLTIDTLADGWWYCHQKNIFIGYCNTCYVGNLLGKKDGHLTREVIETRYD